MANRSRRIIPEIITEKQVWVVKGKHLLDGEVVIHEVLHSLQVNKGQVLILKLLMKKAYDRVC